MTNLHLVKQISTELNLKDFQVNNVVQLIFEEECTIPFVARYRKEKTGSMDEVQIRDVRDRFAYLQELESTKIKYLKVVEEHCSSKPELAGKFPELKRKFEACTTKNELEDLYLPFKPKRRTRAMVAKEKGLEPLLEAILAGRGKQDDLAALAINYVTKAGAEIAPELKVNNIEEALSGAADIYAERIAETAEQRAMVRRVSTETGQIASKMIEGVLDLKPEEKSNEQAKERVTKAKKYEVYFDYREPLMTAPSHRVMAVRRGEAEKVLRVAIEVDTARILGDLKQSVLGPVPCTDSVKRWTETVCEDAYKRLISPSIETELRLEIKKRAEDEAIHVFTKNLENLLLLPPIPGKVVMGVDPGLRTGSKLAVISDTGKVLAHATIYPDPRNSDSPKSREAKELLANMIKTHNVACLAIGNGTGSREIDRLIVETIKEHQLKDVKRLVVNEAGASVYSTDPIAREEFPDLDPTIRSAISIGRRLQDPLAELVKIDPRSIGVGQYQHDVNVTRLNRSLTEVVESCVNKVGVNLNTASFKLLSYVSGIGPALAKGIVEHRNQKGKFNSRAEITNVAGLGAKVFQQAAGFLRLPESINPLDNSAVHPESYDIVEKMAKDMNQALKDLIRNKEKVEAIPIEKYVTATVGVPTLKDIQSELIKPGRDPREDGSRLMFSDDVTEIGDLKLGMKLKGTVSNVTKFGAFVDIGVHQDGLIHISELSDEFVSDPSQVVAVGDVLDVRVIDVDMERRRISLSCKSEAAAQARQNAPSRPATQSENRPGGSSRPQGQHGQPRGNGGNNRPAQGGNQYRGGSRPPAQDDRNNKNYESKFSTEDLLSKFNQFAKGAKK
jgi:uncharacterized protein